MKLLKISCIGSHPERNTGQAILQFPPSFTNGEGLKAYITNIYTDPDYRGKGLAPEILSILEKKS